MATNDTAKPRVPAERPHPRAAARDPGAGAEDRPGFDKRQGETLDENLKDLSIDGPRLTPQGRADPDAEGEDSTNPMGEGAKQSPGSKAEGE